MPCPHDFVSPQFNDPDQFSLLASGEAETFRNPDVGGQPQLCLGVTSARMDVERLAGAAFV
jgi:hypothetical protein